jgi:hypothetical protein
MTSWGFTPGCRTAGLQPARSTLKACNAIAQGNAMGFSRQLPGPFARAVELDANGYAQGPATIETAGARVRLRVPPAALYTVLER